MRLEIQSNNNYKTLEGNMMEISLSWLIGATEKKFEKRK